MCYVRGGSSEDIVLFASPLYLRNLCSSWRSESLDQFDGKVSRCPGAANLINHGESGR